MIEKKLIEAIKNASASSFEVDEACYKRLQKIADEYGENGETAKELLIIVRRLLETH